MGQEIVYCAGCQNRLTGAEFDSRKAFKVGDQCWCADCARKQGIKLPPEEPKAKPAKTAPATAAQRRSVSGSEAGLTPLDPLAPGSGAEEEAPRSTRALLIGGLAVGGVVLIVVLLLLLGGGGAPEEDPGSGLGANDAKTSDAPAGKPAPPSPQDPLKALLDGAYQFASTHPRDFDGQINGFKRVADRVAGTPHAAQVQHALEEVSENQRRAIAEESRALADRQRPLLDREEFSRAQALIREARRAMKSGDWTRLLANREREVVEAAEAAYAPVEREAIEAQRRGATVEVNALRRRVNAWGRNDLLVRLDRALAAVKAGKPPKAGAKPVPAKPPEPAAPPEVREARLYAEEWEKAAALAADRDYAGAIRKLRETLKKLTIKKVQGQAIGDSELFRKVRDRHAAALARLAKTRRGEKLGLEYLDSAGERARVEGAFERAGYGWIDLRTEGKDKQGKPVRKSLRLGVGELLAGSLGAFMKGSGEEALTLAAFYLIEGEVKAAEAALGGKRDALPPTYWKFAERRAASAGQDFAGWEARDLFHSVFPLERAFKESQRRGGAGRVYRRLLDEYGNTAFVRRNRELLVKRSAPSREYVFFAEGLEGAGTFRRSGNDDVRSFWTAEEDSVGAKAPRNYVRFTFKALPETEYRCWAYVGACCRETFTFNVQGTGLTKVDPKTRRKLAVEPGSDTAMTVSYRSSQAPRTHATCVRKGTKAPALWGWVSLPVPKQAKGGGELRLLTNHRGFSVAFAVVSADRTRPPTQKQMELLDVVAPPAPRPAGPVRGLVAWWKFDEGSGEAAADATRKGHDGEVKNGPAWVRGRAGGALRFDGKDDHVRIPDAGKLNFNGPFSVAFWFRVESFKKRWQAMVTKGDSAWRVQRQDRTNHIAFDTTGLEPMKLEGTTNVNDRRWHHAAAVYDGKEKRLYVDGRLEASTPVSGNLGRNDKRVFIGANAERRKRNFHGAIDDVRLFGRALSEDEVRSFVRAAGAFQK